MVCKWDTWISKPNLGHLIPVYHDVWLSAVVISVKYLHQTARAYISEPLLPIQLFLVWFLFWDGKSKVSFSLFFIVIYIFHSNTSPLTSIFRFICYSHFHINMQLTNIRPLLLVAFSNSGGAQLTNGPFRNKWLGSPLPEARMAGSIIDNIEKTLSTANTI